MLVIIEDIGQRITKNSRGFLKSYAFVLLAIAVGLLPFHENRMFMRWNHTTIDVF